MSVLVPMRPEAYAEYLRSSVAGYADDNIASEHWPKDDALERSRAEFESLLDHRRALPLRPFTNSSMQGGASGV